MDRFGGNYGGTGKTNSFQLHCILFKFHRADLHANDGNLEMK